MEKTIKFKNISSTNRKKTLIILAAILLVGITSCLTYFITSQKIYSTVNLYSEGFNGTYLIPATGMEEYISIVNDSGTSLEGTYVNFNASYDWKVTGTYKKANKNYVTLYTKNKKSVFATIIYLNKSFYLLRDGKEILKIQKTSDEAITPYDK